MAVKVCHITNVHKRYDVRVFQKECVSLAEADYDVSLVVCDEQEDEERDGVHIVSVHYEPKSRMDRMRKAAKLAYQKALALDADIYQIHDPELLPYAKKLKKKGKCVVFDVHEDVPEQIKGKNYLPRFSREMVSNIYEKYSGRIMRSLDALLAVTPQLVEKLLTYNPRTVMVTNYPIVSSCEEITHEKRGKYVCFAGGISAGWKHDVIIQAIVQMDNVNYIMAGPDREDYLNQLRLLDGWDKVTYLGVIPHEQVKELYAGAIAGMAINDAVQCGNMGTLGNTKLFEYMEAGIPVICTDYILWKEVVEGNHCGICINRDSVDEVANAIRFLLDHPDEAEIMGENGRHMVLEKYNWNQEKEKLIQLYKELSRVVDQT